MILGIPKEIKNGESRVALTPSTAQTLKTQGHTVLVGKSAGKLAGFFDEEYKKAGANIISSPSRLWQESQLIIKVKEPQAEERKFFSPNKILFCYLHLAANLALTRSLLKSKTTAIAFETVQNEDGRLPLLEPMSEVAGKMAVLVGAHCLATPQGGSGILLAQIANVSLGRVVILGGGTVGENAAKLASAFGCDVIVIDYREERLKILSERLPKNVSYLKSSPENIETAIRQSDLIVGAVLNPGAKAPKLITKKMLKQARPGTVLVDVCIDQGGVSETSKPTTHSHPTYFSCGVLHYCVTNMPGAYGRSSSLALSNAITPSVLKLANLGLERTLQEDIPLARGLNTFNGKLTRKEVAESLKLL